MGKGRDGLGGSGGWNVLGIMRLARLGFGVCKEMVKYHP